MLFAELDGTAWAAIVTAICVGVGLIITQVLTLILNYRREEAKIKREEAVAKEVREVARQAALQGNKLDDIHTLVNSNMGNTLRLTASVSRRLATITKDSADFEAAELAEKLLAEHDAKQHQVDLAKASK